MNARNLKSNSLEQRELQRSFCSSAVKPEIRYFFIRKDGEFDSYLESGKRQPKKSEFQIKGTHRLGANKYRHIDNEKLAQIWWAWIGNSSISPNQPTHQMIIAAQYAPQFHVSEHPFSPI